MRKILIAAALAAFTLSAGPSFAAEACRDAKGKFIKCPPPAAAKKAVCKDDKGKFAKCGTPGAKPVG